MLACISMLGPLATFLAACLIAFIAWQQWQVARNKLRLDLFDRRYKTYDATKKFLMAIRADGTFSDSQLFEFVIGTSDAEFLFDAPIIKYLTEIRKRALDMRLHQKLYEPLPVGDERSRHSQAEHDELIWLSEQIETMIKAYTVYLGFSHIK
jgi:hypothetical protein